MRPREEGKSSATECKARGGRGNVAEDEREERPKGHVRPREEGNSSATECKARGGKGNGGGRRRKELHYLTTRWENARGGGGKGGRITKEGSLHKHVKPGEETP